MRNIILDVVMGEPTVTMAKPNLAILIMFVTVIITLAIFFLINNSKK